LTSIKANIGHAEAASGAASLAKLILMLRNRKIPALISLKNLNPNILDLESDGTHIPTQLVSWNAPHDSGRRLAVLNNFGAAGSNAAMILEEPSERTRPLGSATSVHIVGISCDSEEAIEARRAAYIRHLEEQAHSATTLADFSYTATARRQIFRFRLAGVGKTKEELIANLRRAQVMQVGDSLGKTVFVFSGQGGQYLGMGIDLYKTLPAFRRIVDKYHWQLVAWGFPGILGVINPAENQTDEDFRSFQSAVFVLEYALTATWKSWGLKPDAVIGHRYAVLLEYQLIANLLSVSGNMLLSLLLTFSAWTTLSS
jgi:acyl transferase domain-containing protein